MFAQDEKINVANTGVDYEVTSTSCCRKLLWKKNNGL